MKHSRQNFLATFEAIKDRANPKLPGSPKSEIHEESHLILEGDDSAKKRVNSLPDANSRERGRARTQADARIRILN